MEKQETVPETNTTTNESQILVVNITWNPASTKSYRMKKTPARDLPTQFSFDLPASLQKLVDTDGFEDAVEAFVYKQLTAIFSHEVYHCQIYLPLKK